MLTAMIIFGTVGIFVRGIPLPSATIAFFRGALGRLPSQSAAILSYLDPVVAIILSALFLRESLGWQEMVGAALISGSALCNELTGKKVAKKG